MSVTCIYETYVFSGLNAAKGEIGALKTSVNTQEKNRKEHVQSKQAELSISLILLVNKLSVVCIYDTYVFSGLNAAKEEMGTLKTSVNTLEREKREHAQSKYIELSIVWFY